MALGSPQWMYKSGEAYTIDQSLKFNNPDNPYLSRTFVTPTNRKIFTFSGWVKRSFNPDYPRIISTDPGNDNINFMNDDTLRFQSDFGYLVTTMKFRDASAWYHIMYAFDSTQSTEADRLKLYVNGTQVTSFGTSDYPTLNDEVDFNSAIVHDVGRNAPEALEYMDGYLAELYWVDGQALTPSDFGETGDYGEWKPVEYSGTYGNNGFYLPFKQDYTVEGFSVITWKGDSTSQRYFGGTGFNPDLIWAKARNVAYSGSIYDSVRGYDRHHLVPGTTEAENGGNHVYGGINSTSADGFTTFKGTDSGNPYANHNESARTYVAWNWDMGANTPTGFGCVTWSGDSTAGHSVGGVGFQPDLIISHRRSGADNGMVFDSVRGPDARLLHNVSDAEATISTVLEDFEPDGFRVGSDGYMNYAAGHNYIAWCWNMGGTSVANTAGSINSTVRANTTYGQSIVSYTGNATSGATIGHGLNSKPEMIIVKNRDANANWAVLHKDMASDYETDYLTLNGTGASIDNTAYWNDTEPTNALFSVGNDNDVNKSGDDHIAYCFHSVTGYSKIGKYTGNGNASGTSVTTGFRPAWVMIRVISGGWGWSIYDSTRNPLNPANLTLQINSQAGDATSGGQVQFNSNGFQIVNSTNHGVNNSGDEYIYIAFAGGKDSSSTYNTTGTLDARVKASTTYGQSIVSYTGNGSNTTVGHGLSSAPEMMIVKRRDTGSTNWWVYHKDNTAAPATDALRLDGDNATTDDNFWNDTAPSSSLINLGTYGDVNASGGKFIAYCFHSVTGYSKIGSYTGNGSSTGPSVTCGFKPAFVMFKNASTAGNLWAMYDNTRNPTNRANLALAADSAAAEADYPVVDFDDNGFQIHNVYGFANDNGDTYIYMAFADKREYAYWLDQSGNNNDFTSNNLTESDISVDSPTNNFCVMNPLSPNKANLTFSEGNLKLAGWDTGFFGTMGVSSGKWYWEMHSTNASGNANNTSAVGIVHSDALHDTVDGSSNSGFNDYGGTNKARGYYGYDGNKLSASSSASYGATFITGDIIGVALNLDDGEITFYKNNVSQGVAFTSLGSGYWFPLWQNWTGSVGVMNFGQDSSFSGIKTAQGNQDGNDIGDFYYTPPSGFLALCTSNLPDVAVTPSEHFNAYAYPGNGGSSPVVTGTFQPDLIWVKDRGNSEGHSIVDSIRGFSGGNANIIRSNTTGAEYSGYANHINAITTTGFTTGGSDDGVSNSSRNYVAWVWKAGGNAATVGSNTDGSINTTDTSANVDAGFSIVTYTGNATSGATVGHGLSKAPEVIMVKKRTTGGWMVYHSGNTSAPETEELNLEVTEATQDVENIWNDTAPTASVFYLGNNGAVNGTGATYVAYCFHSVDGYSKMGYYKGNSNSDGAFIYTGFRPAFVITKLTSTTSAWNINDNKRDADGNPVNLTFKANESDAENSTMFACDFLSNGFKLRDSGNNNSTQDGVFIAFAETPFKYSNAR